MKASSITVLLLVLLNSCAKIDSIVPVPNTKLPGLDNTWKLTEVSGGFSGSGRPVNAGEQITFHVEGFYHGSLVDFPANGTFRVTEDKNSEFPNTRYTLSLNGTASYYANITNDTLTLSSTGSDGFNYTFVKK